MGERVRSIEEVLADLEAVAVNFDNGWRAEPPTMAALVRRVARDIKAALAKSNGAQDMGANG